MGKISSNVDGAEIAKFSELALDWWNPYGPCKPLHDINPLRFSFIQQHTPLNDQHVLDVGCGGGILTLRLAQAGCKVTGLDLCENALQAAALQTAQQGLSIDYQLVTVEEYAQDHAGTFDVITCMELLEHVPDPASIVSACAKLLKPNGHLFLSTINRNLKAYLYAIVGAEYFLKLLPKGTHHYEKFIKPSELFEMLLQGSLSLSHMAGIHYHPIFKAYRLTRDVSVNYLVHAQKDPR